MNVPVAERPLAAAVALSGLDGMTWRRLGLLLRRHDPETALAVARGDHPDEVMTDFLSRGAGDAADNGSAGGPAHWFGTWRAALDRIGVAERYSRLESSPIHAVVLGSHHYPSCLADDPQAPAVLYHLGDLGVLDGRRVAVVGTRSATSTGRRVAAEWGHELARHGVRVVSGLARGIDGQAHRGALAADGEAGPPVGVVASGLDVVYPPEHRDLWAQVAQRGVLLSERPPGASPRASSFPDRNRILAGVSELVLVVESRSRGGSLITARLAGQRDIAVMAVPGSVASKASEGTNQLIRDGVAAPALDPQDVLVALGLDTRRAHRRRYDPRPRLDSADQELFDLVGGDAVTLEQLAIRSGRELVDVAMALGRMETAGWVARSGGWFEALPSAAGATAMVPAARVGGSVP